jgi:hypothetical protein
MPATMPVPQNNCESERVPSRDRPPFALEGLSTDVRIKLIFILHVAMSLDHVCADRTEPRNALRESNLQNRDLESQNNSSRR